MSAQDNPPNEGSPKRRRLASASDGGQVRRLAAILSADIVGYSKLMTNDEEGTHLRVQSLLRDTVSPAVFEHRGRIIKTMGDGFLAMFDSPVEAVRCGIVIQQNVAMRNLTEPEDIRIQYRVGVNLGDVILHQDDIFGDGVNVAARLQSVADPGGVCISGGIYEQVKNKIVVGYQSLGDEKFKNITDPVHVYRVLPDPAAASRAGHTRKRPAWLIPAAAAAALLAVSATSWAVWQGVLPFPKLPRIADAPPPITDAPARPPAPPASPTPPTPSVTPPPASSTPTPPRSAENTPSTPPPPTTKAAPPAPSRPSPPAATPSPPLEPALQEPSSTTVDSQPSEPSARPTPPAAEAARPPAPKQETKQEPKQPPKQETKQEPKQPPKQETKQEPKQEQKQPPKQETKQEPKQATKQEPKQEPAQAAPPVAPQAANTTEPFRDCADCPEMKALPAGSFEMGLNDLSYAKPVHKVTIAAPFAIGLREVTFAEWDACVADGGCTYRPNDRGWGRGNRPVTDVSWNDAKTFIVWLSQKTGHKYRLPSEAEWEYAARGGTTTTYHWGRDATGNHANCVNCAEKPTHQTLPTGSFAANAFGLFDVAGNAAEWVEDCWNETYRGAPSDGTVWTKGDCQQRVLRGGSFASRSNDIRSGSRFRYDRDVRYYANGFRVVREMP